jgi:hypothetical protein
MFWKQFSSFGSSDDFRAQIKRRLKCTPARSKIFVGPKMWATIFHSLSRGIQRPKISVKIPSPVGLQISDRHSTCKNMKQFKHYSSFGVYFFQIDERFHQRLCVLLIVLGT